MAENKKGFILYCDLIHTLEQLPDEKAGELFKHILRYVNDQNPVTDDLIVNITFEPIKQQLKRDLKQWEDSLLVKSNSGKLGNLKRWNNDLYVKVLNKSMTIEEAEIIANDRKVSQPDEVRSHPIANVAVIDTVTVTDTVTVKDTVKEITIKKKKEFFNFKYSLLELNIDEKIVDEWLIVRKQKKLAQTETAFAKIKNEIEKSKLTPNECIKIAVQKSWGGFEAQWLNNINNSQNGTSRRDLSQINHTTAKTLAEM